MGDGRNLGDSQSPGVLTGLDRPDWFSMPGDAWGAQARSTGATFNIADDVAYGIGSGTSGDPWKMSLLIHCSFVELPEIRLRWLLVAKSL